MRNARRLPFVFACLVAGAVIAPVDSGAFPGGPLPVELFARPVPAVHMDKDRRVTPGAWAKLTHADRAKLVERFGASAITRCGDAVGTAQLTLRSAIITTAAHCLISTERRPHSQL